MVSTASNPVWESLSTYAAFHVVGTIHSAAAIPRHMINDILDLQWLGTIGRVD